MDAAFGALAHEKGEPEVVDDADETSIFADSTADLANRHFLFSSLKEADEYIAATQRDLVGALFYSRDYKLVGFVEAARLVALPNKQRLVVPTARLFTGWSNIARTIYNVIVADPDTARTMGVQFAWRTELPVLLLRFDLGAPICDFERVDVQLADTDGALAEFRAQFQDDYTHLVGVPILRRTAQAAGKRVSPQLALCEFVGYVADVGDVRKVKRDGGHGPTIDVVDIHILSRINIAEVPFSLALERHEHPPMATAATGRRRYFFVFTEERT